MIIASDFSGVLAIYTQKLPKLYRYAVSMKPNVLVEEFSAVLLAHNFPSSISPNERLEKCAVDSR